LKGSENVPFETFHLQYKGAHCKVFAVREKWGVFSILKKLSFDDDSKNSSYNHNQVLFKVQNDFYYSIVGLHSIDSISDQLDQSPQGHLTLS